MWWTAGTFTFLTNGNHCKISSKLFFSVSDIHTPTLFSIQIPAYMLSGIKNLHSLKTGRYYRQKVLSVLGIDPSKHPAWVETWNYVLLAKPHCVRSTTVLENLFEAFKVSRVQPRKVGFFFCYYNPTGCQCSELNAEMKNF